MIEGRSSRTAQYMALFRALENARPKARRLFEDRFAARFLSPPLSNVARAARVPLLGSAVIRFIDIRWPGARSSAVARTRLIDDAICRGLGSGIEQVVLLGAGFDARAYRLPGIQQFPVFEIDHPDTLAAKREAVEQALGEIPEHVVYVPLDFNERRIEDAMREIGFDEKRRTYVVWEGVTNYLDEDAVRATLRWCAQAPRGSHALFTYVHRRVIEDPLSFYGTDTLLATLKDAGEAWTFGLDPDDVPAFVAECGLELEQDLGADGYRAMYYGRSARSMRGYEFYRIAQCRPQPR